MPDTPTPPVPHPEAVEADVIVRIDMPGMEGVPALVTPLAKAPPMTQEISPEAMRQIDGSCGYFRARWTGDRWAIGEALPRAEWPIPDRP